MKTGVYICCIVSLVGLNRQAAQQVCNASFKGWAARGSFYVISTVCHADIACSKNIASPTASCHSFLIIALLLLRLLRGSCEGKVRLSARTLYVGVGGGVGASLAAHYRSHT